MAKNFIAIALGILLAYVVSLLGVLIENAANVDYVALFLAGCPGAIALVRSFMPTVLAIPKREKPAEKPSAPVVKKETTTTKSVVEGEVV